MGCPLVEDSLEDEAATLLKTDHAHMLFGPEEMMPISQMVPCAGSTLRRNMEAPCQFILRLMDDAPVEISVGPKHEVLCGEECCSSRLIVDARPANEMTRDPHGVALRSADGLSRIEVQSGDPEPRDGGGERRRPNIQVHFAIAGMKDCFHRLRAPPWLRQYFALLCRFARAVGLAGVLLDGHRLLLVKCCLAMLCVEFS